MRQIDQHTIFSTALMKSTLITSSLALTLCLVGFFIGRATQPADADAEQKISTTSSRRMMMESAANQNSQTPSANRKKITASDAPKTRSALDRLADLQKINDPLERTRQWLLLVDSLQPNEFEAFVAAYRAEGISPERMSEYAVLLTAWAKVDPLTALDYATKNTGNPFARQTILSAWAGVDPDAAIAWAKSNHQGEGGNPWMVGVIKGLAFQNPELASSLLQQMPRSVERGDALNQLLPALISEKGMDGTREWITSLQDPALKEGAMTRFAERTIQTDPAGTADWLIANPSQATNRMLDDALYVMADRNPQEALDYFNKLPAGELRSNGLRGIINATAIKEPQQAVALMNAHSADVTDRLVEQFVWHSFRQDPAAAVSQIERLTDPGQQEAMYLRTLSRWMERDQNAATNWANNHPLPDSVRKRLNAITGSAN
ncbi:MAG: hypothetical protein RL117_2067 [Verrucomicrobiota bacterium]|jgi:hypothetical protein